jgi:hypothetical protein
MKIKNDSFNGINISTSHVKDLTNQIIGHYRNKPENSYQCNTALKLILKKIRNTNVDCS